MAATVAAAVAALAPAVAHAIPDSVAVMFLNTQRVTNGLPGLAVDPVRSFGCSKHNSYMSLNGMGHGEDPGKPGYSEEGAAMLGSEVVSSRDDSSWGPGFVANPWRDAPIHLLLMFDPRASVAGYDASAGFTCMRLGSGPAGPAAYYSVPAPGAQDVIVSQNAASELPYSPAEAAGLQNETTGFNIMLYPATRGEALIAATLTGPAGVEPVRILTSGSTMAQGGAWTWGTIVVPELVAFSGGDYVFTANWASGAVQTIPFRTVATTQKIGLGWERSPGDNAQTSVDWRVSSAAANVTAMVVTDPRGRSVSGTFNPARTPEAASLDFRPTEPGVYRVCATAGGERSGYVQQTQCGDRKLKGVHQIDVRRVKGGLRITASPSARGLKAILQLTKRKKVRGAWTEPTAWSTRFKVRASQLIRTPKGSFRNVVMTVPGKRVAAGTYQRAWVTQRYSQR